MPPSPATSLGQPELGKLIRNVLECYTTRSGKQLVHLYDTTMTENFRFLDGFADASPLPEARLQFFGLQKLFSEVKASEATNIDTTTIKTTDEDPPSTKNSSSTTNTVTFDCQFEYIWSRESSFTRWILPESTVIDSRIELIVDGASGKVMEHHDTWQNILIPTLPLVIRRMNVVMSNALMRGLGWEKEMLGEAGAKDE